jgi:hypothetical protein
MTARCDRLTMRPSFIIIASLPWLAVGVAHANDGSIDVPARIVSSLRVTTDDGVFSAIVEERREAGYDVEITCVSGCPRATSLRASVDDSPLGLFTRDQDDLLFSTWSAGSAYRVRVWALDRSGIVEVAELSSRGRPAFTSDRFGHATIRTFESESGVTPFRPVLWTYRKGAFIRRDEGRSSATPRPKRRSDE